MQATEIPLPADPLPLPFEGRGARLVRGAAGLIAVTLGLFHLYTSTTGILEGYLHRSLHYGAILVIVFLVQPAWKGAHRLGAGYLLSNLAPALLTLAMVLYQTRDTQELLTRADAATDTDFFFGVALTLLTLEACRRAVGLPLALVTLGFLLYTWAGRAMPEFLAHAGFSLREIAEFQFMGFHGVYNIPLGVMSTFIILFILFGAFLEAAGTGTFFIQLAAASMGHRTGGPAKAAVVASGLLGSLTGSVVANVLTTGAFTIPLMKQRGYPPAFAAAVEAAASSGGQIMPPVMGAAAFLIAQFLGVPYGTVAMAAFLPAILYFLSIGWFVHLQARRSGIAPLPKSELPDLIGVLRRGWYLLLPLLAIVGFLVYGYSAIFAGLAGIGAILVVSFIRSETRVTPRRFIWALERGAGAALTVSVATAAAGIIMGSVAQTGLALRLTSVLLYLSGGVQWITLVLTMISCVILGMGMPTAGAYIVVAALGASALIEMGIHPMSAHMFIFYFASLSAVTPPVALAAYAGAGLAGADPWRAGLAAFQISLAGFIIPFVMVYDPSIMLLAGWVRAIVPFASVAIGTYCLAACLIGFIRQPLGPLRRGLFLLAGVLLIGVDPWSTAGGFVLFCLLMLDERRGGGHATRRA
jgi:TRAP transporter 4TM/12TM fusion protein